MMAERAYATEFVSGDFVNPAGAVNLQAGYPAEEIPDRWETTGAEGINFTPAIYEFGEPPAVAARQESEQILLFSPQDYVAMITDEITLPAGRFDRLIKEMGVKGAIEGQIRAATSKLIRYQTHPANSPDLKIKSCWQALQDALTSGGMKADLGKSGIVISIGGSMIYGDPVNLDCDAAIISGYGNAPAENTRMRLDDFNSALGPGWWQAGGTWKAPLIPTDLGELEAILRHVKQGTAPEYEMDDVYKQLIDASMLISGVPVYSPSPKLWNRYVGRVERIMNHNPVAAALTLVNLEDTLARRLIRKE